MNGSRPGSNPIRLQFADDLGFSKTNVMHLVIGGKRRLTVKSGTRIAKSLGLEDADRRYFELLVRYGLVADDRERNDLFLDLQTLKAKTQRSALAASQMELFTAWHHPVIHEMMMLPGFSPDPRWIAAKLSPSIDPEAAKASLDLMTSLGLVAVDDTSGAYALAVPHITTGDEVASSTVAKFHQQMMDLGMAAVASVDDAERDVGSVTIAVSAAMAAKIKAEVQEFRTRMLAVCEASPDVERVYQLNIQLFPVTAKA
jgi:uncharacterized protein (TIGR02147 family)